MRITVLLTLSVFMLKLSYAQPIPADSLYFGQTPPDITPKIFAPGLISVDGRTEYGISISPDGKEMLFAIGDWPNKRTMIMEYKDDKWTGPDTVSFAKTRSADEAIFSFDGQRVYYYAYNAPNSVGGADLCYSEKQGSEWGEPVNIGSQLNTIQDEYHPCVVADSSIYIENVNGKICYIKYESGSYQTRVLLPALFNDPAMAWGNPYVSPDESYFIFNSSRAGGFGDRDLYISYKKDDGSWTNPKNLGSKINTEYSEHGSEITPDGKYMTFVSNDDIYWVSSGFIDSLEQTNFIPYVKNSIRIQTDTLGHSFSYTIPDSIFVDDDGNNTLTYSATLSDGSDLPAWLSFDAATMIFSGIPTEVGSKSIKVTASDTANTSASTTFALKIVNPISSVKLSIEQNLEVYPNPTKDKLNISFGSILYKNAAVELTDINGRTIFSSNFHNTSTTTINLTGYPKGYYFLILIIDGEKINRRICLE